MPPVNEADHWWHALAWLSDAEPLVCPPSRHGIHWPDRMALRHFWPRREQLLQRMLHDPRPLNGWMARIRDRRLGMRFEHLLLFWLMQQSHLRLLAHGLPVREQGRTLGAVDFLLQDLRDGSVWHWEVACKFYLQTSQSSTGWQWLGPDGRDKLADKLRHMTQRQLRLAQQPQIRDYLRRLGIRQSPRPLGVIWGRLFHTPEHVPGTETLPLNPNHPRGVWFNGTMPSGWRVAETLDLLSPQQPPPVRPGSEPDRPVPCWRPGADGRPEWAFIRP